MDASKVMDLTIDSIAIKTTRSDVQMKEDFN